MCRGLLLCTAGWALSCYWAQGYFYGPIWKQRKRKTLSKTTNCWRHSGSLPNTKHCEIVKIITFKNHWQTKSQLRAKEKQQLLSQVILTRRQGSSEPIFPSTICSLLPHHQWKWRGGSASGQRTDIVLIHKDTFMCDKNFYSKCFSDVFRWR